AAIDSGLTLKDDSAAPLPKAMGKKAPAATGFTRELNKVSRPKTAPEVRVSTEDRNRASKVPLERDRWTRAVERREVRAHSGDVTLGERMDARGNYTGDAASRITAAARPVEIVPPQTNDETADPEKLAAEENLALDTALMDANLQAMIAGLNLPPNLNMKFSDPDAAPPGSIPVGPLGELLGSSGALQPSEGSVPPAYLGMENKFTSAIQIGQLTSQLIENEKAANTTPGTLAVDPTSKLILNEGTPLRDQGLAFMEALPDGEDIPQQTLSAQMQELVEKSELAAKERKDRADDKSQGIRMDTAHSRQQLINELGALDETALKQQHAQKLAEELLVQERNGVIPEASARGRQSALRTGGEATTVPVTATESAATVQGLGVAHAKHAAHETQDRSALETIQKVAQDVRWMVTNRRSEMSVKLHPEHLGELHMKITQEDGALRVDMTVDNRDAKILLDKHMPELRAQLTRENPTADTMQFNVDVRQGQDFRQQFAASQPLEGSSVRESRADLEVPAVPVQSRRLAGDHSVSIYV
ncbi:MAG: flagellar hook-length control protein FliK, partial [Deltaproteobacteria bacterium]|nr:flagellar hook-length control protein FliK [Deltaproteobacteria bacterium]